MTVARAALLFLFIYCLAFNAGAQLKDGSVAPNFTLKDVNGNVHDLYTYLNQGKTVFVEFFTTWCPPCKVYHQEGHLDTLYREHGPAGAPGVYATTTNDIVVLMVEIEHNNGWEDLYGGSWGGYDWVTGTPYPILDTPGAAIIPTIQGYQLQYIPTTFMICRDRLTKQLFAPNADEAYQQIQHCPSYPPSASTDAKATPYQDKPYFICNANPRVRFQNYSQAGNINNASINIKSGGSTVYTYSWAGNLAPYQVATVNIPQFSAQPFMPYTYEVKVTGDSYAANDETPDPAFRLYGGANSLTLPDVRNYESPDPRLSQSSPYCFQPYGKWWDTLGVLTDIIGINGMPTTCLLAASGQAIIGNYNTLNNPSIGLQFDYSCRYEPAYPDTLIAEVSTTCGSSWQTVWTRSGAELAPSITYAWYQQFPMQSGNWKHFAIDLTGYQSANLMLRVRYQGIYGVGFLDNIKLTPWTTGIASPGNTTGLNLQLAPNPVTDVLYLTADVHDGELSILNSVGQIIATYSFSQSISIPTHHLSPGMYMIRLTTEQGMATQKFIKE